MEDFLIGEASGGLEVKFPDEGGGTEVVNFVDNCAWIDLGSYGQEVEQVMNRGWPTVEFTSQTSSPSNSSLPSASGPVGESEILLIHLTTPCSFILEIGTSELEQIALPLTGIGPPVLVHLSTSWSLYPETKSNNQYSIRRRFSKHSQLEYAEVQSGVGASETGKSPKWPILLAPQVSSDFRNWNSRETTWLLSNKTEMEFLRS
ncbi:hypothetical protein O181_006054 [Austropuccinia psidii MF-1]|uniref:Uncharacterized protein n=1 Tax=Austropuccinia psidii MF-1 TaxID=1389203 RepID=A0A9Q3BJB7_9BASI|nr:hypothetical protein [Austropuccinia psidii MF-1]